MPTPRRSLVIVLSVVLGCSGQIANDGDIPDVDVGAKATGVEYGGKGKGFEVWLVDQSDSPGVPYGGTIHIYDGQSITDRDPSAAAPSKIDLAGAVTSLCTQSTGAAPVRPHMLVFTNRDRHAVLSFVASGHVVFFDANTRQPLACFRTEVGAGGARQAHAIWPTGDDRYILVANQNGKKFERIRTDYAASSFVQEPAATLNLATCSTPSGLPCEEVRLRPDNAPICPFTGPNNGPAFASLRGGGLLVVDWQTTPMSVIGEYDRTHVPANGCGFVDAKGKIWGNGGGATPANPDQFTVYRIPGTGYSPANPPNVPAVEILFDSPAAERDAHGVAATKNEHYVWMADRDANLVEVFDSRSGARVNTVSLISPFSSDPTPDLIAWSPDEKWFFMSTRGPNPLSGDPHSSQGSNPGMLIVRIEQGGRSGTVRGLAPITNVDASGIQRADAHAIRMRRR